MGTRWSRADIVGELFCSRTPEFATTLTSSADHRARNRRATSTLPSKAAASAAEHSNSRENDAPCPSRRRPFFSKARYARQVEQSRLHRGSQWPLRLPNKATTARRRPVFVIKSSEWSAARPAFEGGSRRQRWAAPSCMLALLAWHSCIVAAAKRMSAALGRARSAPSHRAWHACMMDLFHTTGTYFLSHLVVVYGCQCHRELCSCW